MTTAMKWPEGFMWGTGASATQCEGAAETSDWIDRERSGDAPRSGDGNGFATHYAGDFALLASLGLTHHRLSIDWARIEPAPGEHDEEAVEHYRKILQAARIAGITPWICLLHFTQPRWFTEAGGFRVPQNRTGAWARHVDFVAETFGDLAGGWQPINETNYYARLACGKPLVPIKHESHDEERASGDGNEVSMVDLQIQLANAEAAVRLRQTGLPVASIFGLSEIVAQDDHPDTTATVEMLNDMYWRPGLGLFRDGVLHVRDCEPIERQDLAEAFDLIGFSYYATIGVAEGRPAIHPPDADLSPLGYGVWADGLGLVLDRLATELPDTPLLVAEYGIGTDDDSQRTAYLRRGLVVLNEAIRRGVDVRGFFHWTAVDNYEWLHGYDVRFGIIDTDRTIRPSARVLQEEAGGGRVQPH